MKAHVLDLNNTYNTHTDDGCTKLEMPSLVLITVGVK